MTMTTSDIISRLGDDEDLNMLEYTIVKHWGDNYEERIYFDEFDSFVDYVFDLDIHGWELVGFNKSRYPRTPDSYSIYLGKVRADFYREGY